MKYKSFCILAWATLVFDQENPLTLVLKSCIFKDKKRSCKCPLRSGESAFWAAVVSSELPAFGAAPDKYFSAVWAIGFCGVFARGNCSVA